MTSRKRFRGRLRRGAAAVEAVIVASVMVIIMACLWGAVNAHKAKLTAMDAARALAWKQALAGCEGSGNALDNVTANTGQAEDVPGMPNTSEAEGYIDFGDTSLTKDSGYIDLTKSESAVFPGIIGGNSYEMKAHMYMRCNEPPAPDNVGDFFKTAFGVVKGVFGF